MRRAVFLDRDGVINKAIIKNSRPLSPRIIEDFEIISEAEVALKLFRDLRYINIIATNQPDIARGLMRQQALDEMHNLIREKLAVDDIFICPHDDSDNCHCRKPKPGMIIDAAVKWNIDLGSSYFIGDTWKDIYAGKAAGCLTILLERSYNENLNSDYVINTLLDATKIIKR